MVFGSVGIAGFVHPGFLDLSETCRTYHFTCRDDAGGFCLSRFMYLPNWVFDL